MTDKKYKRLIQAAVPSKEVRDYCETIGRKFAPYEFAVLICQNTLLSYSQKHTLLAELVPALRAEPDSKLKTISGVFKNHYSNAEVADEIEAYIAIENNKKNLLERFYEETDEYRRRKTVMIINFKLSTNGIRIIFGNEAKLYIKKDLEKTETDKTIDALRDFSYEYENDSEGKYTKLYNLRRIEKKYKALTFFKTLQNIITKDEHRFIVYDITKDYLSGVSLMIFPYAMLKI